MKLSKRTLFFVIPIGAFLIIALVLISTRPKKDMEWVALNDQFKLTQSRIQSVKLEQLYPQKSELEQQLKQTQSRLDAAKTILSQPIKKTEITDTLFTTAKTHSIDMTKMNVSELKDDKLGKVPASAVTISITVEGEIPNIVSFITKLNTLFPTGAIETANLTASQGNSGKKALADVNLKLFTVEIR